MVDRCALCLFRYGNCRQNTLGLGARRTLHSNDLNRRKILDGRRRGTTISPYLFFWQASQEVEEIKNIRARKPLLKSPGQGPDAIQRIKTDTYVGMGLSNLVALAIVFTTAATLHATGHTDIETSSQAAEALRPVAGLLAFIVFALGIIGTGLWRYLSWLDPRRMQSEKHANGRSD